MQIFTEEILAKLAANGAATAKAIAEGAEQPDHFPVVKVFNPYGSATWLLTESDPDDPDCLYGLCDLGMGSPELGSVLRSEIEELRIKIGTTELPLERDAHWKATRPISYYAHVARGEGRIVDTVPTPPRRFGRRS
jgi:hypothetical protein